MINVGVSFFVMILNILFREFAMATVKWIGYSTLSGEMIAIQWYVFIT